MASAAAIGAPDGSNPLQVHVELPVGEGSGDLMRPVHGQRCLADASDPGDYHDPR